MANIAQSVVDLIGKTPLISLQRLGAGLAGEVVVKLEAANPGGSVKDRIALGMVCDAEARGVLKPGVTVVEPTSGNTGVGLAMVCAARGYRLIVFMPDTMSVERRRIMAALGAELRLTPGAQGMRGAIDGAQELVDSDPEKYVTMGQFDNPANPESHRLTTAEEIWTDTDGEVDVFVAGVGTGGTVSGVGSTLKAKEASIKVIAVEPVSSPVMSGGTAGPHKIQGIGAGFIPANLDMTVIDEVLTISSEEAGEVARRLAAEEGLLVGISAGAAMAAALKVAERSESAGKRIVVLLPDTGERYLSTWLFAE